MAKRILAKIGEVTVNTAEGQKTFNIIPVCTQHYIEAYGYMMVDSVPVELLSMNRMSSPEYVLSEGAQERAQYAYDSYVANNGRYNSSMSIDGKQDVQIHEFDLSLLDDADADYYEHQGSDYMFMSSHNPEKEFRFYIRDIELMEAVYERLIQPRQNYKIPFAEYITTTLVPVDEL